MLNEVQHRVTLPEGQCQLSTKRKNFFLPAGPYMPLKSNRMPTILSIYGGTPTQAELQPPVGAAKRKFCQGWNFPPRGAK